MNAPESLIVSEVEYMTADMLPQLSKEESSRLILELIVPLYSQPQRHYHTLSHIHHLLKLLREYRHLISSVETVALAILFHDIVYEPSSGTNEEDSASLFIHQCEIFPAFNNFKDKVVEYILATKSHAVKPEKDNLDLQLFLDMDMAILGSSRREYIQYCMDIRREYEFVEVAVYCRERSKFLAKTLESQRIFHAEVFFNLLENLARSNIKWEQGILLSGTLVSLES